MMEKSPCSYFILQIKQGFMREFGFAMPERTITKLFQKWVYGKIQYAVWGRWWGGGESEIEMFVPARLEPCHVIVQSLT